MMKIKKYIENLTYDQLSSFLKNQEVKKLHLNEDDYEILRENRISGLSFLSITKDDLLKAGLYLGPAIEIYALKELIVDGL